MENVLVVDNNPVMLKYMDSALGEMGYSVKSAENGLVALDLLENYTPDIIFVDLIMPYIRGDQLVSILRDREELAETSIIIISGIAAELELDYLAMGADACIAKGPFNTMGKHISFTLDQIRENGTNKQYKPVIGLEDVYKRAITQELIISNNHLKVVLDSISDCIVELNPEYRIVNVNNSALGFLLKERKELIAESLIDEVDPRWKQNLKDYLDRVWNRENPDHIELYRDKECFFLKAEYLESSNGDSIVVIISDISVQKQREEELKNKVLEREMMVKEVYHRVKNNLAIVSSIINLQMSDTSNESEIDALNDLRSRIDSISMVHSKLFRGKDLNRINLDDYLTDLVGHLIDSLIHDNKRISAEINLGDVNIDVNKAVPLGIVMTELTTNAIKYAFRGMESGIITISYEMKDNEIEIVFSDNGNGLPDDFSLETAESLGVNLVLSLVMQLEGTINFENNKGAKFIINMPPLD